MPERPDWDQLAAYFAGELPPDEAAALERWIAADPEGAAEVARLRAAWTRVPDAAKAPERPNVDAAWRRLKARTSPNPRARRPIPFPGAPRTRRSWPALRIAAAIVIAAATGVVLWQHLARPPAAVHAPAEWREYATGRGQRGEMVLSDGTHLWLGPASRLRVSPDYGTDFRTVTLDGEAMFTVVHDASRPFSVRTARGIVEDIGTEFVVTDYRGDHAMRVVVASGAVSLRKPPSRTAADTLASPDSAHEVTLRRGDLAQMEAAGATVVRNGVDVTPYVSWTRGALAFDNALLGDAVHAIDRWYDTDMRLGDPSLAARHITVTLNTESLADALQVLQTVLDVRVVRRGATITLYPHDRAHR